MTKHLFLALRVLLLLALCPAARATGIDSATLSPTGTFDAGSVPFPTVSATFSFTPTTQPDVRYYVDGVKTSTREYMTRTSPTSNVWTARLAVPRGGESIPEAQTTYTFHVEATDQSTGTTAYDRLADGSITVLNDHTPPVIDDVSFSPHGTFAANVPVPLTVTAHLHDPAPHASGVLDADVQIFQDGQSSAGYPYGPVALASQGGDLWTGTLDLRQIFGPNGSSAPHTYTLRLTINDAVGYAVSQDVPGKVVVLNDNAPPVVTRAMLAPSGTVPADTSLTALTLTAHISDAGSGVGDVTGTVYLTQKGQPVNQWSFIPMKHVSGDFYRGMFYAPFGFGSNRSDAPLVWTGRMDVTDAIRNYASHPLSGSLVVLNDNAPPVITNATITPTGSFASRDAPTVTVSATVTDTGTNATGVKTVTARLASHISSTDIVLTRGAGDVYTGKYALPPNHSPDPLTYAATVGATDGAGSTASASVPGSVTVRNDNKALQLSDVTVTPNLLPNGGGTVVVSATVMDANPGATLNAIGGGLLNTAGGLLYSFGLSNGGSGNVYTTTVPIGAGDSDPRLLSFSIGAFDSAQYFTQVMRYAAQAGTAEQPAPTLTQVSPSSAFTGSAVTLSVTGTNFTPSSVVLFGGQVVPTTFVSATLLTAAVESSLLPSAGRVSVTVFNPAPGGGAAAGKSFSARPRLVSVTLSPATVTGGGTAAGTVTLEAAALSDQTVVLSVGSGAAQVPASVVVQKGQTGAAFSVTTGRVSSAVSVVVTASLGTSHAATLHVTP